MLARENYKAFADIGPIVDLNSLEISVLGTSGGTNLIRKSEILARLDNLVSFGSTGDLVDANNRPLRTVGTIKIPVTLGRFVAAAKFIVCQKLAFSLMLGADYCDRFFETTCPQKKTVELVNFSYFPVFRRILPRKGRSIATRRNGARYEMRTNFTKGESNQGRGFRDRNATGRRMHPKEEQLGRSPAVQRPMSQSRTSMHKYRR